MLTISSPNMHRGRLEPVELVVLHTAQAPCLPGRAAGVMQYLSRGEVGASAHYCCDPTATVAGVAEHDTAWGAAGANANGIHIEQCGYAEYGRVEWPSWNDPWPQQMLREQLIPLIADLCRRHNIPPVVPTVEQLRSGRVKGITTHVLVNAAFRRGDHWDCGENYPLDDVVRAVAARLGDFTPTDQGEPVVLLIRSASTGSLWWWNGQTRALIQPRTAGRTWTQIEASLRNLIALHPSATTWPDGALHRDLEDWDLELIPIA
ncbi:MAG: N-acetylmuramoyl-L-alanine amidase [Microthrixaceae bacterium]|nr:N-acetylmuramoyl-L-alanine amidase [Microthrixaceae bacterium]